MSGKRTLFLDCRIAGSVEVGIGLEAPLDPSISPDFPCTNDGVRRHSIVRAIAARNTINPATGVSSSFGHLTRFRRDIGYRRCLLSSPHLLDVAVATNVRNGSRADCRLRVVSGHWIEAGTRTQPSNI